MENTTEEKKENEFTSQENEVNQDEQQAKPPKSLMISFRAANEQEYRELCALKDEMIKDGTAKSFRDLFVTALKYAQSEGYFLLEK